MPMDSEQWDRQVPVQVNISVFRIKWTCPAREQEAMAVWLTKPSITVSAMPTRELIRFCMAMGMTMAKNDR